MQKYLIGLIVGIIITGAGVGGFFVLNQNKVQPASTNTIQTASNSAPTPTPTAFEEKTTAGFVNPSATIDAIQTAFAKSDKTLGADLGDYLTDPVLLVLYGSEAAPATSKKMAVEKIDVFFKSTTGWDFSDTNTTTQKLAKTDQKMFGDKVIGTTPAGQAVAFRLNNNYLIEEIVVVPSYTPYLPQ